MKIHRIAPVPAIQIMSVACPGCLEPGTLVTWYVVVLCDGGTGGDFGFAGPEAARLQGYAFLHSFFQCS